MFFERSKNFSLVLCRGQGHTAFGQGILLDEHILHTYFDVYQRVANAYQIVSHGCLLQDSRD